MTTAYVRSDDAEVAYECEGTGPFLLAIAGRGGTGDRFAGLSAILKDSHTVVRYDRRCCGRSTGDATRPMDLMLEARDALAVLRELGAEQASVFGSSAGAAIALKIAEFYPERITNLIAHEPMVVSILPDAEEWIEFNKRVQALYRTEGMGPALKLLASSMVGLGGPGGPPGPPPGARPGPGGMDYFLGSELMSLSYYRPDLERIKRNNIRLTVTKGLLSRDAYYARTADVISEQVGCPLQVMPGNHIAVETDPGSFAAELRPLL